jgi:hypothetical protein
MTGVGAGRRETALKINPAIRTIQPGTVVRVVGNDRRKMEGMGA